MGKVEIGYFSLKLQTFEFCFCRNVYGVVFDVSCCFILIGCWGPIKGKILKKKKKKNIQKSSPQKCILCIHVPVFYSSRIRTLVAMVSIDL